MNRIIYYIFCFLCIVFVIGGCNLDGENGLPNELNLVSPNGIRIAKDIHSLKHSVSVYMSSKNDGMEIEFDIINIEYHLVSEGFVAFIEYRLDNGIIGRIMNFSNNSSITPISKTIEVRNLSTNLKNRSESGDGGYNYAECVGTCPDNKICKASLSPPGTTFYCYGCDNCKIVLYRFN